MNVTVDCKKFTCPICFLLPGKEIYQCKNGHILCDKCIERMQECPQCRVSLQGDEKGRNRALEEILDDLKIDCPFSNEGCLVRKVGRSELSSHQSACTFGKEVQLCKLIALKGCNFKAKFSNLSEVAHHMETVHRPALNASEEGEVSIKFPNVFCPTRLNGKAVPALYGSSLIQFKKPRAKILFVMRCRYKEKFLSWIVLDLSSGEKRGRTHAEISSEESPSMKWRVPVYHVMEAEERIKNPSVRVYMPSLVEQRRQETPGATQNVDFVVNIKITDTD